MIAIERELRDRIAKRGGFVNAHAHFDRANTLPHGSLMDAALPLAEKWSFVDRVKQGSSFDYEDRIRTAIFAVREHGTTAAASFIDVDEVAEDRGLKAAVTLRRQLDGIFPLRLVNQTLKGVLTDSARQWFDRAVSDVDIIGGLPKKDSPHEADHLDVLLSTAKRLGKLVHVHVDQFNDPTEHETELLAKKTIEHGMEGRVWAVHSISLAAQKEADRRRIYQLMRDARLGVISCPFAWIDASRSEIRSPTHNAIAPIDELMEAGIPVTLGSDNIGDVMKPLSTGDMWLELRLAIEACRLYRFPVDQLVDLVTTNGRKALGLSTVLSSSTGSPTNASAKQDRGSSATGFPMSMAPEVRSTRV